MTCTGPECERPATRRGLCHGHRWQLEHGRPLAPLRRWRWPSLQERIAEAWRLYWDSSAEDDAEFERNRARVRMAMLAAKKPPRPCVIPGCGRRFYARGFCKAHHGVFCLPPSTRTD